MVGSGSVPPAGANQRIRALDAALAASKLENKQTVHRLAREALLARNRGDFAAAKEKLLMALNATVPIDKNPYRSDEYYKDPLRNFVVAEFQRFQTKVK
jgi:hypothetical protein